MDPRSNILQRSHEVFISIIEIRGIYFPISKYHIFKKILYKVQLTPDRIWGGFWPYMNRTYLYRQ